MWKRLVLFAVLMFAALSVFVYLTTELARLRPSSVPPLAPAVFLAAAALGLNALFFRWDGESLAAIGFNKPLLRAKQFALAFVAGAALVSSWLAVLLLTTPAQWKSFHAFRAAGAVALVLVALVTNFAEELTYRGYAFVRLQDRFGAIAAILITTTIYTLLHLQRGVPLLNALAGIVPVTLIFAAVFARTRSLPLLLGLRLGVSVVQDVIGLRVTALSFARPVYAAPVSLAQMWWALGLTVAVNLIVAAFVTMTASGGKR